MKQFEYVEEIGFQCNFEKWFSLNCEERMTYNEKPDDREEAVDVFVNYMRARWQEGPRKKNLNWLRSPISLTRMKNSA